MSFIYFLLIRSNAFLRPEYTNDLYVEFIKTYEDLTVKDKDQNFGNTLFSYFLEFNTTTPIIKAKQE